MKRLLLALGLICTGTGLCAEPAFRVDARLVLNDPSRWFGGFSGAEISSTGDKLTLINDRARLVSAALTRKNGRLTGAAMGRPVRLRAPDNRLLRAQSADTEGLAIGAGGKLYVSFEHNSRVAEVDPETGRAHPLPRHPDFARFEKNKGPEALAIHPDGTLYTLPERSASRRAAFPLYAYRNGIWRVTHKIPRRGAFLTVGADFDAEGRLYLLERAVSPLGFRSRVRRFDLDPARPSEETLLTTHPSQYDNLEAITIWRDPQGQIRATLISDDNFLSLQQTEIVEFILHE